MIIKARAGKGGQALARYLESGKNEHAEAFRITEHGRAQPYSRNLLTWT